ncbi:MAG: glycosyltransferase family 2 protein [Elusimicrobia bacterium]|nr:glycosyltransferase family 2 protein [Elusimicrobiota bacterium]
MDKVCVLLPAYNEAGRVAAVVRGALALSWPDVSLRVVVVDDGSTDDTIANALTAGARVVSLGANLGVGAALRSGFELAREEGFDYLVHIDADGQIDPSQIPALLAPVRAGTADVAIGSRFLDGRPEYLSAAKAAALRLLARAVGLAVDSPLTDLSCGIRALNAAAIAAARPSFEYDYVQETLLQFFSSRMRVVEVPVKAVDREGPRGISARSFRYISRYLLLLAYGLAGFYLSRLRRLLAPAPAPRLLRADR